MVRTKSRSENGGDPKPARRPQAERSADTRAKVIRAAIACLHRGGYAGATVGAVAQEAGVSRGALTHQFAGKTDLMLAVVREVFEQDSEQYNRSVSLMSPKDWLATLPATMWRVINQPAHIAAMEIMLASRSDPDLALRLREIQSRIDEESFAWVRGRYAAAGLTPRPDREAVHRLFVAAVRGLALEAVYMKNADELEKSIAVLGEMMSALNPALKS
ncbi:MAG: transcriptional regulator, TetR family [Caulobacter sp.]|nr:transcriptional regulator, TetR family [Caulobacter sp.]